jgi:hypothetical protein
VGENCAKFFAAFASAAESAESPFAAAESSFAAAESSFATTAAFYSFSPTSARHSNLRLELARVCGRVFGRSSRHWGVHCLVIW